jgi:branched-chain amino acid transport system permease protein
MEVFVQQLINGLTLGSIYGLIAIGYTMVFGIIGMINFAHGDVFMVSAFIALILFLILTTWLGIASVFVALLLVMVMAMVLTALWGWTLERIAYRPLRGSAYRSSSPTSCRWRRARATSRPRPWCGT